MSPLEDYEASRFTVDLLYRPSVSNNISNWKIFEGDEKIVNFLTNKDDIKDLAIDNEHFQEKKTGTNPQTGQDVGNLKAHTIPKGITNLESMFDLKDHFKGPKNVKSGSFCPLHGTVNLGTPKTSKNVNLGKTISKGERNSYLKLFRQYQNVFMWSYKDLKMYDTRIIQHTIPLNPKMKPFQQNL